MNRKAAIYEKQASDADFQLAYVCHPFRRRHPLRRQERVLRKRPPWVHGLDYIGRGVFQEFGGPSSDIPSFAGMIIMTAKGSKNTSRAYDMYDDTKTIKSKAPSWAEKISKIGSVAIVIEEGRNQAIADMKAGKGERVLNSGSSTNPTDATAVRDVVSVKKR